MTFLPQNDLKGPVLTRKCPKNDLKMTFSDPKSGFSTKTPHSNKNTQYVVRDPRALALSRLKRDRAKYSPLKYVFTDAEVEKICHRYKQNIAFMKRPDISEWLTSNMYLIRYEEFMQNPDFYAQNLAQTFGIYDREFSEAFEASKNVTTDILNNNDFKNGQKNGQSTGSVVNSKVFAWKREMSLSNILKIEKACGEDTLLNLGY